MSFHVIILAAGQGKRMHSDLPKVLHPVGGKPMLQHVIETAEQLNPARIHIICGHKSEQLQAQMNGFTLNWVEQSAQLGTGHAVKQVLPHLPDDARVLILSGDVPLIRVKTLQDLVSVGDDASLNLLTAHVDDPFGLGRILRNDAQEIIGIVEERDATACQRLAQEVYSGILSATSSGLKQWLPALSNDNAQGEYYLTEIISLAVEQGVRVINSQVIDNNEVQGVNDRSQLQFIERALQSRFASQLMQEGVTLLDASRFDLRGQMHCARDVSIDVNCVFEGLVKLGAGVRIDANCHLKDVSIEAGSHIFANSVLEQCHIGQNNQIGPFARIRPGTALANDCKVGNFVEMKKTTMSQGSKASHLSYLGDATIGENVNIGAGTITCNFDGTDKHQTIIEDGAFIGSDSQLVAPVTIGKNATIGAGSTIRRDAPANQLSLTEAKQRVIAGWKAKKITQ